MTTLLRPLLAVAAALALSTSMAWAQDRNPRQHDDDRRSHAQRPHARPDQQAHRPDRPDQQARRPGRSEHQAQRPSRPDYQAQRPDRPDYRQSGRHAVRPPAYRPPRAHAYRGAGPNHNWYRGARMPAAYRTHHYVVNDWRGHHLSAPPRGYYWVQNGGDYLLIAIASGVIAQIILGN